MSEAEKGYSPGLAGVVAGETAVACVEQGVLWYRGYPIQQLAESATFEEVAHLLLFGSLPTVAQIEGIRAALAGQGQRHADDGRVAYGGLLRRSFRSD
mgnify:CR=1 FL=1